MHLSILDRYIFREVAFSWAAVTLVLFAIMISHTLLRVLIKAGGGELGIDGVLPLLIATTTNLLVTIVPLGVYLGIILGLGRMYQDSEMVVLSACGVGVAKLYKPILALGLVGMLVTFPLTVWVSPWAEAWEQQIKALAKNDNFSSGMRAGAFVESQNGKVVLFARTFTDQSVMRDVFMRQTSDAGDEAIEVARSAYYQRDEQTGEQFLVFVDGQRTTFAADGNESQIIEFAKHGVRIPEQAGSSARQNRASQDTQTLFRSQNLGDRAEFLWRIGIPLAAPVLAFLALPLAYTSPRQGRYGKLALAILIYILYTNVLVLSRKWLAAGQLPEWLGLWWVHALLLLFAVTLLNRVYRLVKLRSNNVAAT